MCANFLFYSLVFLSISTYAESGASTFCAIPGVCLLQQFPAGKVPEECDIGKTFQTHSAAKAEQAVFQYNGPCKKKNSSISKTIKQTCKSNVADGDMLIAVDVNVDSNDVVTFKFADNQDYAFLVKGTWHLIACPTSDTKEKCVKESGSGRILYTTCK